MAGASLVLEYRCPGFSNRDKRAEWLQLPRSRTQAQALRFTGFVALQPCGSFPDWGSNPHLPHWQTDSSPLSHQETLFSSVQSLSLGRLFATPWAAAHEASLGVLTNTDSRSLLKLMSVESVMPSNQLTFTHCLSGRNIKQKLSFPCRYFD